jgi:amino acid adenylation domain-containing protein
MPSSSTRSNIADSLWLAADSDDERVALIDHSGATTYGALRDRASAIASALVEDGVLPGDRVGVLVERGAEGAAAYFGAIAAGAVVTVINERLRPRQVEYILRHSGARALLTSREMLAQHQRELETEARIVDLATIARQATHSPAPRANGDLAQIIFTSGSTGLPKGVVFTHGTIRNAVDIVVGYLGLAGDDRLMSLMPFSSVYGLNQLLCSVRCGATLVVSTTPVPHQLVVEARAHEVTVIAAVPPLWLQLLATPAFRSVPPTSLRILQNAGGHLPVEAVRQLRAIMPNAKLFLQYGMTETFRSTYLDPAEVDAHPDSIGRPVPGAAIVVVGDTGQPCGPGEVGELVFSGPTTAEGYWNAPEQTAATFRSHPFDPGAAGPAVYSGDLVRTDETGRLFYVSRRDRLIKSLGFRIGPDEIADVLYASGEIREAVITTEPDPVRGERIIAYVALAPDGSLARLQQFCREELPRHMQPARIEAGALLPRLPSGKYDLDALRSGAWGVSPPAGAQLSVASLPQSAARASGGSA